MDHLKVDGDFVRDTTSDPMSYVIVQAVNEIGHVADLRTIAEFVEDDAVPSIQQGISVDLAQGFGIAGPMAVVPDASLVVVGLWRRVSAEGSECCCQGLAL